MEQTFELSSLNKFLYQTLIFTEEVKNVLKSDCDEATFSLKPWCVETIVKREPSENTCICSKTSETEVEEIAAGISRALLQTQLLREKLSLNVIKERKCSKQPSITSIYNPGHIPSGRNSVKKVQHLRNDNELSTVLKSDDKDIKSSSIGTKKLCPLSSAKQNNVTKLETRKKSPVKASSCKNIGKTGDANKHLMKPITKSAKDKDFLKINKLSIKNANKTGCHKSTNERMNNNCKSSSTAMEARSINLDKRFSAASTSELKSLIQKVSTESNTYTSSSDTEKANCPLHGDVSLQFNHEQSFMDVVDSLDRFSIPGEIVKTLKAYHTYLKAEYSDESIDNGKRQKTVHKFLVEFEEMNKNVQERLVQQADFINLSSNFISLFQNLFSGNLESASLDNIKKMNDELNSTWKKYDTKDFNVAQTKRSSLKKIYRVSDHKGWMSNGIWNHSCIENFEGIARAYCIRYMNKNQLLSFFAAIQQWQQTQYFTDLIDIILQDIIPKLKENCDSASPEYIKAYKMICILKQGLNPKVPVLVRTNE